MECLGILKMLEILENAFLLVTYLLTYLLTNLKSWKMLEILENA